MSIYQLPEAPRPPNPAFAAALPRLRPGGGSAAGVLLCGSELSRSLANASSLDTPEHARPLESTGAAIKARRQRKLHTVYASQPLPPKPLRGGRSWSPRIGSGTQYQTQWLGEGPKKPYKLESLAPCPPTIPSSRRRIQYLYSKPQCSSVYFRNSWPPGNRHRGSADLSPNMSERLRTTQS